MRALRVIVAVGLVGGLMWGSTPSAWAGGGTGNASCQINNPGKGAIALKGTVAVEVLNPIISAGGNTTMDAVLRLERGGVLQFFYATFSAPLVGNEQLICDVLAPVTTAVVQAFGLGTRNLCITDKSLSKADAPGSITIFSSPERALSAVDVTVYAVEAPCG